MTNIKLFLKKQGVPNTRNALFTAESAKSDNPTIRQIGQELHYQKRKSSWASTKL